MRFENKSMEVGGACVCGYVCGSQETSGKLCYVSGRFLVDTKRVYLHWPLPRRTRV